MQKIVQLDRMITAQDYNTILLNNTGGVQKVKSINRTFSGHSRYPKFIDPTGDTVTYTYKVTMLDYIKKKNYLHHQLVVLITQVRCLTSL